MNVGYPETFTREILLDLYHRLLDTYGPQYWWPADTCFEVMVGAVLTQNTAWINVEKAIANIKQHDLLLLEKIVQVSESSLAELIRPSGYFNVKARRLKNLFKWIHQSGGIEEIAKLETDDFRNRLLSVNGVGPETADDILLYGFNRPVFVIDTYTRRLLKSLELIEGKETYDCLQNGFQALLDKDYKIYNEYHALIVRHAKQKCGADTGCVHCRVQRPFY